MTATPPSSTHGAAPVRASAGADEELAASNTSPSPATARATISRRWSRIPSTGTAITAVTAIDAAMQDCTMKSGRCCSATAVATAPTKSSPEPARYQRSATSRSSPDAEPVADRPPAVAAASSRRRTPIACQTEATPKSTADPSDSTSPRITGRSSQPVSAVSPASSGGRRPTVWEDRAETSGGGVDAMAREFGRVGVIGLGTMGAGIVEVFARNGLDVVAVEASEGALEHGRGVLQHSTDRAVARGKLTPRTRPHCCPMCVSAPRWRTWPTATSSSRRCPSTSTSNVRSSASSTPS